MGLIRNMVHKEKSLACKVVFFYFPSIFSLHFLAGQKSLFSYGFFTIALGHFCTIFINLLVFICKLVTNMKYEKTASSHRFCANPDHHSPNRFPFRCRKLSRIVLNRKAYLLCTAAREKAFLEG
jgi:hypothetical protein